MTRGKSMVVETLILTIIGAGVGLGVNEMRRRLEMPYLVVGVNNFPRPPKRKTTPPRELKPKIADALAEGTSDPTTGGSAESTDGRTETHQLGTAAHDGATDMTSARDAVVPATAGADPDPADTEESIEHAEHEFTPITAQQVLDLVDQRNPEGATTIIVDARDNDHYEEGHIPGAYQCFSRFESQWGRIREYAIDYQWTVVVYCNGGECTDSIDMCRRFVNMGVPPDNIRLFEGGWSQWSRLNFPVETGTDPRVDDG